MKSLIREIRNQPDHIRELIAGLCTVVIASLVALVWFNSFKHDVFVLLNPDQQTDNRFLASDSTSLFGYIGKAFSDGKAQITEFIKGSHTSTISPTTNSNTTSSNTESNPHALPVSGDR